MKANRTPESQGATSGSRSPDLAFVSVSAAMCWGTITCSQDTPLRTVARILASNNIHCVVVVGIGDDAELGEGLWGVVSDLDLVENAGLDIDGRTAGDAAASPVVTVTPDERLERAAQLMTEHDTAHLIVVN